jgi:hypothetical protein
MSERLMSFGALVVGDVMVAKDKVRWTVLEVSRPADVTEVTIRTADKTVTMKRPNHTPCTIDRPEPKPEPDRAAEAGLHPQSMDEAAKPPSLQEAVETVKETLGGQVLASVTDAQQASLDAASEDEPVRLPPFDAFNIMQARSHLFLCHGLIADDVATRAELAKMHDDVTANPTKGRAIPHVHGE